MSFGISVKGGTGAGRKRPLMPANTIPWACNCLEQSEEQSRVLAARLNPGYLRRCIDCGTSRDPS